MSILSWGNGRAQRAEARASEKEESRLAGEREAVRRARARQAQVAAAVSSMSSMSSVPAPRGAADDAGLPRRSPIAC